MSLRVHVLSSSVLVSLVRITQEVVLNHCGAFTTISLPLRISTGWPFGLELAEQIQAVFAENRILKSLDAKLHCRKERTEALNTFQQKISHG